MAELVLGPVVRYVDQEQATVWVQTDSPCEVEVLGCRAPTFAIEDHFYALVVVSGLEPGSVNFYEVRLDGKRAWPPPGEDQPPCAIRTLAPGRPLDLAFGSCRENAPHEAPYALPETANSDGHGIDALRTLALELGGRPIQEWPDALLMLGDQLYADEPPRHLVKALRHRDDRPDGSARAIDFVDYALLYREAWSDPAVRRLLAGVPSMMIFDDHEILDEWKISEAWVDERRGDSEYERRVTAGLMAYWVYQHLGNLSPAELDGHELLERITGCEDGGPALAAYAAQADRQVGRSRWSFARDFGPVRLLVLDSRATRRLTRGHRRILDDGEWQWARQLATSLEGVDHLLLASSLPFLLPRGLHHVEAAIEALADGARGPRLARVAERARRALNLGHWASFQASFDRLRDLLEEIAAGRAGRRPASVLLLSGDVHHGYMTQLPTGGGDDAPPVWQVVCSPFRKRLARHEIAVMRWGESPLAGVLASRLSRLAGAHPTRADWRLKRRPSYANQIARLRLEGRHASVRFLTPEGSPWQAPELRALWEQRLA